MRWVGSKDGGKNWEYYWFVEQDPTPSMPLATVKHPFIETDYQTRFSWGWDCLNAT